MPLDYPNIWGNAVAKAAGKMDDIDRLTAAIFSAAKCSVSGPYESKDYIEQYEACIQLMKDQRKAIKKPIHISHEVQEKLRKAKMRK